MTFIPDLFFVVHIQRFFLSYAFGSTVIIFLARYAIFLDSILILILFLSKEKRKRHGVEEAAWTTALALVFVVGIAKCVLRARPFLVSHDVLLLIPAPYNTSFPSGHTAAAISIALALYIADRRIGMIAFFIAGCVALGRISAGVHYPTDILGGIFVGCISFYIVRKFHSMLRARNILSSAAHHIHDA